ncbi:hypothetical protein DYB32_009031, partial [Aphanomyces invadans]
LMKTHQGDENDLKALKIELSTETDLFFYYSHVCDLEGFHLVQEQQKLMVDFSDYANVLIRMLNNCIKEPHNHIAVYLMQADGRARLDFIQEVNNLVKVKNPSLLLQVYPMSCTYHYPALTIVSCKKRLRQP